MNRNSHHQPHILPHLLAALLTAAGLGLGSCAHRSGHRERPTAPIEQQAQSHTPAAGAPRRNLSVEVAGRRGGGDKLEGKEVFARFNTAVFMVYTSDGRNVYQGSGFFINADGLAVSNYHVFHGTAIGGEAIKLVGSDDAHKVVEVVHKSEKEDFILFRVDVAGSNYIPVARSKPQVGERVFAIGSPQGLENTFSSGEVSQWRDKNLMQISVQIDHGSSGGALINEYGEVVGITSGTFAEGSQANLNYAWSIEAVKPYVSCK